MRLKVRRLHQDAKLPSYAHPGDAALDLYTIEDSILKPNQRQTFKTGIAMEIPKGYVGLIWDKGSKGAAGIHTLAGVVDSSYRGEIGIVIQNLSDVKVKIEKGEKLSQILIQPVESVSIKEVAKLSDTPRGEKAWGSTGKK